MRYKVENFEDYPLYEDQFIDGVLVRQCTEQPNYGISKCGKVFRLDNKRQMTPNLRGKPQYWNVRTCHNNVAKNTRLHVMLALCWVYNDDPENKLVVNHIDGNPLNNEVSNLEWCTLAQNNQHGRTLEGNYGEGLYNSSLNDELAHEICKRLVYGERPKDLAEEFGLSSDVVRKIKTGSTWFHVRKLYDIPDAFKQEFSSETIHWVCKQIVKGISDLNIAKNSTNSKMTTIEVKRIRHKIRFQEISDMYF